MELMGGVMGCGFEAYGWCGVEMFCVVWCVFCFFIKIQFYYCFNNCPSLKIKANICDKIYLKN